jgi:hypothetical protein
VPHITVLYDGTQYGGYHYTMCSIISTLGCRQTSFGMVGWAPVLHKCPMRRYQSHTSARLLPQLFPQFFSCFRCLVFAVAQNRGLTGLGNTYQTIRKP